MVIMKNKTYKTVRLVKHVQTYSIILCIDIYIYNINIYICIYIIYIYNIEMR